jgi:hypothetical protein
MLFIVQKGEPGDTTTSFMALRDDRAAYDPETIETIAQSASP